MIKAASIDIGTNTLRMLIAEISPAGVLTPLRCERIITRLGEGFFTGGMLSEPACRRTLTALDAFSHLIRSYPPISWVHAVATSAVREAINGADFCSRVAQQTGIAVKVLSGSEEARLTLARGYIFSPGSGPLFNHRHRRRKHRADSFPGRSPPAYGKHPAGCRPPKRRAAAQRSSFATGTAVPECND